MVNWSELFKKNERLDKEKDSWAEYTDPFLQKFMKSDFMEKFAMDCSTELKKEGNANYEDYFTIKAKMNSVLEEYGYPSFRVMEDAYSEEEQLKVLEEFKEKYLK